MRLLLTRALADAARTRVKLEGAGHRVLLSPVIEIVATGNRWPAGVVDALIATSGQAFAVMDGWDAPSPEAKRLLPLFLVGDRTADLAAQHGFVGATTVAANVAMLAISIGNCPVAPKRAIYLAGRDRKPDLETALDVIWHPPEVIEVYDARATEALTREAVDALRQTANGGVLHFSRRSAALFRTMSEAAELDIRPLTHFCLSEDVAAPLREAGCDAINIAEAPNESALLNLIDPPMDR